MALFRSNAPAPPPLAVSMGEPAGVGLECALKAWRARKTERLKPFFLLANVNALRRHAEACGLNAPLREITVPEEAPALFNKALPVMPLALDGMLEFGKPNPIHTGAVIESIRRAVMLAWEGKAAGVVTLPFQKVTIYQAGFRFPGHTEYLADLCKTKSFAMMLDSPGLRVAVTSTHVALRAAIKMTTQARIAETGMIVDKGLRNLYAIKEPRIAVAGLNPHAGEGGAMGNEEREIIAPAIESLRQAGVNVTGPHPPDTLFSEPRRANYDCAICHYHDQGLIPLKTLDFHGGVNVTLGLPVIRTSPDHGTGLDIAGRGKANPSSTIAALRLAARLAANKK